MSDYSRTIQDELQQYQQYAVRMSGICDDIVAARKANAEKALKHKKLISRIKTLTAIAVVVVALSAGWFYLDSKFEELTVQAEAAMNRGDYAAAYHVYDNEKFTATMWGRHQTTYQKAKEGYTVQHTLEQAQDLAAAGNWKAALQALDSGLDSCPNSDDLKNYAEEVIGAALDQIDVSALGGVEGVLNYIQELRTAYDHSSDALTNAQNLWENTPYGTMENAFDGLDYQPDIILSSDEWRAATVATQKTGLFLRTGPGQDCNKILTIPKGDTVYEVAYSDDVYPWVCVVYNGTYGWVSADYLRF